MKDIVNEFVEKAKTADGFTFYISRRLQACEGVRLTSIARGIGFGDELDYADDLTIAHALHNRRPL